jgi:chaperonin GroES
MILIPFEDRVTIKQDEARKETEGGVIIPDNVQKKPQMGTIIAVGPGKPDKGQPIGYELNDTFYHTLDGVDVKESDRIVPLYTMNIKVGDRVMFAPHAGVEFEVEEGNLVLVMRFTDLIARV